MTKTEENLRWTDRFEGPITRILASSFRVARSCVTLPSDREDRRDAKDFGLIIDGHERVVMARMRTEARGTRFFGSDFTLRMGFKKDAAIKTEMDKVFFDGFGDILFYGLDDGAYNITRYRILRVSALRKTFTYDKQRGLILSRITGLTVGKRESNQGDDDTFFWTFPLLEMPDDFDFKLPGSEPLPRKPDPAAGTFFEGLHLNA